MKVFIAAGDQPKTSLDVSEKTKIEGKTFFLVDQNQFFYI